VTRSSGNTPRDEGPPVTSIFIDADGCPVKEEVYRVALRHNVGVTLVANSWMRIPDDASIRLVIVEGNFDAADDWIEAQVTDRDVVVTGDLPLASRCLKKGAQVLGPKGRVHTDDSIGETLARRAISAHLRETGTITGGPSPHGKSDRSLFLQRLDELVVRALRRG
jgi:uncharacterized protein YaiI (UPF0178 family)